MPILINIAQKEELENPLSLGVNSAVLNTLKKEGSQATLKSLFCLFFNHVRKLSWSSKLVTPWHFNDFWHCQCKDFPNGLYCLCILLSS
ncbi:uncharacterized protein RHIMIDRAFT_128129 [Rhizopus microsporus ATCC 52813]|uniref:Uncharacterized protein n=1 Tax=Rhizopus microsporus ATCC 52813 TaxID=1340429 RepID=A0A2G4SW96_RHIZD|nr:uncharacterized protein RHIMIDRAFT_128129 [Rhizopus microsporus ATCC 52813]PHZ13063.1 hypothetical protein RHIMIDRAFT_128129 [Rhizopus microsporus ATCC 52813]